MPDITSITRFLQEFNLIEGKQTSLFDEKLKHTHLKCLNLEGYSTNLFINEFWTARQRQSSSIQEISYRACFKPQLPRFFIKLLTGPGEIVYDPFAGRGTTPLEAALLDRLVISNDVNPLSRILSEPRLDVPSIDEIKQRLFEIPLHVKVNPSLDLSMFYHPQTETELLNLRNYFIERKDNGEEDSTDRWIRMIATNRLTGHSKGFFSVYTMPPNQAVSAERQKRINLQRNQKPEYRCVKSLIIKKSLQLLRNMSNEQLISLRNASGSAIFLEKKASETEEIASESVSLTVTSPPFLNVVQYSEDNWLRGWFNNIDMQNIEQQMTMATSLKEWSSVMSNVFKELYRITRPGGWVAFEVGEVKGGSIKLEEAVIPLGLNFGFQCIGVVVNQQDFTKTSNIWGVKNNQSGTNSNRIVLFTK